MNVLPWVAIVGSHLTANRPQKTEARKWESGCALEQLLVQ